MWGRSGLCVRKGEIVVMPGRGRGAQVLFCSAHTFSVQGKESRSGRRQCVLESVRSQQSIPDDDEDEDDGMRSRVCVVCVCGTGSSSSDTSTIPSSSSCLFPPFLAPPHHHHHHHHLLHHHQQAAAATAGGSCHTLHRPRLRSHRHSSSSSASVAAAASRTGSCLLLNGSRVPPSVIHGGHAAGPAVTCDRIIGSSLHTIAHCCSSDLTASYSGSTVTMSKPQLQQTTHHRSGQAAAPALQPASATAQPQPQPPPGFRGKQRNASITSNDSSASSGWTCVVCCQKVPSPARKQLFAIGPCDHPVCAVCSTKMRVLCDQDECPICRQDITKVRTVAHQMKHTHKHVRPPAHRHKHTDTRPLLTAASIC